MLIALAAGIVVLIQDRLRRSVSFGLYMYTFDNIRQPSARLFTCVPSILQEVCDHLLSNTVKSKPFIGIDLAASVTAATRRNLYVQTSDTSLDN